MSRSEEGRGHAVSPPAGALIADFMAEWSDASERCTQLLVELESHPDCSERLNALFRAVHSMKSNLRMLELKASADLLHAVEELLDEIRAGRRRFAPAHGDLVLLSIDRIGASFGGRGWNPNEARSALKFGPVQRLLARMKTEPARSDDLLQHALTLLDPWYEPRDSAPAPSRRESDLALFAALARASEQRLCRAEGALQRMERMAIEINQLAGSPVQEEQLVAAVRLHDFGMALLPQPAIASARPLEPELRRQLHTHPELSAGVLRCLEGWSEAQRMVLEHHERPDGAGYPRGLQGSAIHPGASLIALIDAFDAITSEREYKTHRRPILRALTEINAESGRQFDPRWVDAFNRWARQNYVERG